MFSGSSARLNTSKAKLDEILAGIQRNGCEKCNERHTYCVSKKFKYARGDLVICKYDFEYLYYPSYLQEQYEELFFIGIIISIKEHQVVFFDRDIIYEVLCTDGVRRNFATWEIEVLRKAKES